MKQYCNNCGFENADKNTFCMRCGAKLSDPKIESREPVAPQPAEINEPIVHHAEKRFAKPGKIVLTSNKNITGLALVAIVLSIVAIIFSAFVSPAITLGSGAIDQQKLADNSVTSSKIVDGTITDSDISDNGISKIADNSIDSANIIDGSLLMDDLASSTISNLTGLNVIANDSITGNKIANLSITTDDLANGSVTSLKILDGTITAADIGTGAVGSDEIASGAVGSSEIADNSVSYGDMAIKIKYSTTPASAYNGSYIPHGISGTPTCVFVTPIYDPTSVYANATIIANVYNVGSTNFYVTLYYQYPGGSLTPVPSGSPVYVYWIAIY